METWQKDHIRKHLPDLMFVTVCSHMFLAKLFADGLLSAEEVELLNCIKSNSEKSMKFYQIIQTRSKSFNLLKQALVETTQTGAHAILNIDDHDGEDPSLKLYGSIAYNKTQLLGRGCNNTNVFRGKLENREVAVKVISILDINKDVATNEIHFMTQLDWHENVVRYFKSETTKKHVLIALELCDIDLHEWVLKPISERKIQMDADDIIYHATKGIQHLHENRVVHRDLKPANILLIRQATGAIRVKISDFGMARKLPDGRSRMSVHSSGVGTEGWMAPEVIAEQDRRLRDNDNSPPTGMGFESDIFSLGCIYYFVLTNGLHPFGDGYRRQVNIFEGKLELNQNKIVTGKIEASRYVSLVKQMVKHEPKQRPPVTDVVSQLSQLNKLQHAATQGRSASPINKTRKPQFIPSGGQNLFIPPGIIPVAREVDLNGHDGTKKPTSTLQKALVTGLVDKFNNNPFLIKGYPSNQHKMGHEDTLLPNDDQEMRISYQNQNNASANLEFGHTQGNEIPDPVIAERPATFSNKPEKKTKIRDQHYTALAQSPSEINEAPLPIKELSIKNDTKSWNELTAAIIAKSENDVRRCIGLRADVNERNDKQETPLHLAAASDDKAFAWKIIKLLILNEADPVATDRDQCTFLDRLIEHGTTMTPNEFHDIATYLVSNKLINLFNDIGGRKTTLKAGQRWISRNSSAFQMAVKNIEINKTTLSFLHESGMNFNHINNYGESVLFYAILGERSVAFVTHLVSLGANPKEESNNRSTLLHFAAALGNSDMVQYFLKVGLDINGVNSNGDTPLHMATLRESSDISYMIEFLISKGAKENIKNTFHKTYKEARKSNGRGTYL